MAAPLRQSRKDVIPAIFIVSKGLQNLGEPVYGWEICRALQDVTGETDSISCVQKCEGLWRITPKHKAARLKILQTGLVIRGHYISVLSKSPYLLNGTETIRLNISNIPYEIPDSDITEALKQLGVKFGHGIQYEFYKDEKKNFTKIKTGRRYVNMAKPSQPLPEMVKIADKYRAYLNYNRKDTHATPPSDPGNSNGSEKDRQCSNPDPRSESSKSKEDFDRQRSNHAPQPDSMYFEEDFETWQSNPLHVPSLGSLERQPSEDRDSVSWPPTPSGWWDPPPGYVAYQNHTSDNESEVDLGINQSSTPNGWMPGVRQGFPPRQTLISDMILDYWKSRDHVRLNIQSHIDVLYENDSTSKHDQDIDTWTSTGFWATPDPVVHDSCLIKGKLIPTSISSEECEFETSSQTSLKTVWKRTESQLVRPISITPTTERSELLSNTISESRRCRSDQDSILIDPCNTPSTADTLPGLLDPATVTCSPDTSCEQYIITPSYVGEPGSFNDNAMKGIDNDTCSQPLTESSVDYTQQSVLETLDSDTHKDHTVARSAQQITYSPSNPQTKKVLRDQSTLDDFLSCNTRRARSLTKEVNSESRKRSSSKRKVRSPLEDTPKGKRPTKSKNSPKSSKKQGRGLGKDKVSRVGASLGGENNVDAHSSAFFDRWLNEQVSTSPT